MVRKTLVNTVLSLILFAGICPNVHSQSIYQPNRESLSNYKCPDWFRDAKFGIFIHWAVNVFSFRMSFLCLNSLKFENDFNAIM